jgi:hypothetical protein
MPPTATKSATGCRRCWARCDALTSCCPKLLRHGEARKSRTRGCPFSMEAVSISTRALLAFVVITTGCADRCFTDLGNGTGVPIATIQQYADQNGVSFQHARQALRAQDDARRPQESGECGLAPPAARPASGEAWFRAEGSP